MGDCCELGYETLKRKEQRVVHETDNFVVIPSIGQMGIEGYVMILSKAHCIGMGDVPESQYAELIELIKHTRAVLQQVYGASSLVFEHGPRVCNVRGGGCHDHAHLHVVPGATVARAMVPDLMERLEGPRMFFKVERTEGFKRLADIFAARQYSYMYVDDPSMFSMVTKVNIAIPPQYLRRFVASQRGHDMWDWAAWPDRALCRLTGDRLAGKF